MKKIALVIVAITFSFFGKAQERSPRLKITTGLVFATSGVDTISKKLKPATLGYNLQPNICFITTKTYHNILYGIGNNAIKMINAYRATKEIGIYNATSKSLSNRGWYTGIGFEYFMPASEKITFFPFIEIGQNFNTTQGSTIFAIGFHANIQPKIWLYK